MTTDGKTTADLAAAIGRPVTFVESLLCDEERRGNVERVGDAWRLTASARETLAPLLDVRPEGRQ